MASQPGSESKGAAAGLRVKRLYPKCHLLTALNLNDAPVTGAFAM